MRKNLLLTLLVVFVVCIAAVILVQQTSFQTWLVQINLPDFPDYPEPKTALSESDEGEIYFQTMSPFDLQVILSGDKATPTTGLGHLTFPDAAHWPVPAMIILPGSGGIKPGREHEYAKFLNQLGIAGFVVEYYAPRGLSDEVHYLIRTASVTEFDLITDAYAALELLSTHPRIDGARIGVVGFSYGGMASRLAMDSRIREALAPNYLGFKVHIDVYGPCFQALGTDKTNGAPLLTLRGTEDASNDLEACRAREDELRAIGVEVVAKVYEGAGHAWENESPRALSEDALYLEGCEWHYDEAGVPWVDGEALSDYDVEASRAQRIAARFTSGVRLKDCVKRGYIIGRDEVVRDQAFADAEEFLGQYL